jgi:hypothetical protein
MGRRNTNSKATRSSLNSKVVHEQRSCGRSYSCRNASTGWTLVAARAGMAQARIEGSTEINPTWTQRIAQIQRSCATQFVLPDLSPSACSPVCGNAVSSTSASDKTIPWLPFGKVRFENSRYTTKRASLRTGPPSSGPRSVPHSSKT